VHSFCACFGFLLEPQHKNFTFTVFFVEFRFVFFFFCVLFSLYNLIDIHLHCVVAVGEKTKLACLLHCV